MPRINPTESGKQTPFDAILRETLSRNPNSFVLEVAKLWCKENDDGYLPQSHPLVRSLLALPIASGRKIRPIAKPLRGVPPGNWVLTSHWTANDPQRLDESVGGILGVTGEHTLWAPIDTLRRLNGEVRRRGWVLHAFLTQWEIAGMYQINLPLLEYNPRFQPDRLPHRMKEIASSYRTPLPEFMQSVNILPFEHRIGRIEY